MKDTCSHKSGLMIYSFTSKLGTENDQTGSKSERGVGTFQKLGSLLDSNSLPLTVVLNPG